MLCFVLFSADSLASRIVDGKAGVLVTADCSWRGPKRIHLLEIADHAIRICTEKGHKVRRIDPDLSALLKFESCLKMAKGVFLNDVTHIFYPFPSLSRLFMH